MVDEAPSGASTGVSSGGETADPLSGEALAGSPVGISADPTTEGLPFDGESPIGGDTGTAGSFPGPEPEVGAASGLSDGDCSEATGSHTI